MKNYEQKELHSPYIVTNKKGAYILGHSYNNGSNKKIREIYNNLQELGFITLAQRTAIGNNGQQYPCYHIINVNLDANPFEIPPADYDGPIEDIMDEF